MIAMPTARESTDCTILDGPARLTRHRRELEMRRRVIHEVGRPAEGGDQATEDLGRAAGVESVLRSSSRSFASVASPPRTSTSAPERHRTSCR